MSRVVLGYLQECANCGTRALISEPDPLWTCPDCTGDIDLDDDLMDRAYAVVQELVDTLHRLRQNRPETPGVVDTVGPLDDDDPEAYPVGQVTD